MKALVTGGAGFIGHHLVRALVQRGDEVAVLDDLSNGRISRLDPVIDRIAFTQGSILEPAALDQAITGAEVVFHEAAIVSVAKSTSDPRLANEVNVGGTIEVMQAAARHRVRRVVFAGSSAVYGASQRLPCTEDQRPSPTSPYGVSKLAGEHYVHALGSLNGVETVVLRYFNVYGPGQDPDSEYAAVIPKFITAVVDGTRPTIYGTGATSRDFVYVDDVVAANMLAAAASSHSELTCNVATGSRTTLLELLHEVCVAAGRDVEPTYGPPREGDILHSQGDITAARRALGYQVSVSLREGIARSMAWYQGQQKA